MQTLNLAGPSARRLQVLCLGAHCDDIEIGCGGTLLHLQEQYPALHVDWVVFSAVPQRERELRASARRFLGRAARRQVRVHGFRDGFFPAHYAEVKNAFEALKALDPPDLIFTHHRSDLHQDHRLVAELTWNTFRNHLIFEYEIPKYEGGLSTPSAYVGLSAAQARRKTRILMDCYASQRSKRWFCSETFEAMMKLRGIESGAESGWAEGFHAAKLLIG